MYDELPAPKECSVIELLESSFDILVWATDYKDWSKIYKPRASEWNQLILDLRFKLDMLERRLHNPK